MKLMAAEPNQVGSPHDKANAEWMLARFKEWGWDAHIETFEVLYPTPDQRSAGAAGGRAKPFKATLQEPPIPGDTSATAKDMPLPAYVAYPGRRRCHRAAGLRQLRHAGRLQGAGADGHRREGQDRHRPLRRAAGAG